MATSRYQEGGGEKKYEARHELQLDPYYDDVISRIGRQADGSPDCGDSEGTLWDRTLSNGQRQCVCSISEAFSRLNRHVNACA